jgi:hypothetical protein
VKENYFRGSLLGKFRKRGAYTVKVSHVGPILSKFHTWGLHCQSFTCRAKLQMRIEF